MGCGQPARRPPPPPRATDPAAVPPTAPASQLVVGSAAWRTGLSVLTGTRLTLRELRREDAPSRFALLTTDEVARFITPPPTTVEGFERFITWARQRRSEGCCACFAVVPHVTDTAVGLFQIHLAADGHTAEWGFALGSPYWGTGLFVDGARLVVDFAFATLGLRRLEARAVVENERGNGALRKIGAVKEGVLRQAFDREGEVFDQTLWTILRDDWAHASVALTGGRVH
ncbi:MAG: GNAT family N-acetyltransferase [Acidimicrobiia bacterium]|nr:GNAT family N-acetyltransferase [Acidimicrobiia bacterium]